MLFHQFIKVSVQALRDEIINMQKYSPVKLWPLQIQPIHNYFLLAATEIGVLGALLLLVVFLIHIKQLVIKIKKDRGESGLISIFLLTIMLAFMVLMQFDHYFYTLEQTQMLLWIFLGMIAAVYYSNRGPV